MEVGKRKTQEKVEGLHKRRPESCGTGRSRRRARPKKDASAPATPPEWELSL